ncbi:MAG: hypothetical protein LBJ64_02780 [Deltaproteobacteria bacterium]|jgi:hypothetical protein|nr:hypothetical protein [Deltaproteobacteria bacterium]
MSKFSFALIVAIALACIGQFSASVLAANELDDLQRESIVSCLKNINDGTEWATDVLQYQKGMSCFNLSGKDYDLFFQTNIFEDLSDILIDQRNADRNPEFYEDIHFSPDDFIHVNKEFLDWLDRSFVSLPTDPEDPGFKSRKALFDRFENHVKPLVYAYEYLTKHADLLSAAEEYEKASQFDYHDNMLEYLGRYRPAPDQNYSLDLEYANNPQTGYADGINRFRFSVGFWLRRQLDGSLIQCRDLLRKTFSVYDPDWAKAAVLEQ